MTYKSQTGLQKHTICKAARLITPNFCRLSDTKYFNRALIQNNPPATWDHYATWVDTVTLYRIVSDAKDWRGRFVAVSRFALFTPPCTVDEFPILSDYDQTLEVDEYVETSPKPSAAYLDLAKKLEKWKEDSLTYLIG